MMPTLPNYCQSMNQDAFLECLEALSACTRNERTMYLHDKGSTVAMRGLRHKISGSHTVSLPWPESYNDINVLLRSLVFYRLAEGHAPNVTY
jgi:hypothetical protein